ncbi:hypothetical protein AJ87_45840 [Rhizobium yanglingense]|nr:hypothetical protein AJ87_45840 [Rhizobium yanglingense]
MTLTRQEIMAAYLDACRAEIDALKPGNVHRFADGHRMTADQFLQSAAVIRYRSPNRFNRSVSVFFAR